MGRQRLTTVHACLDSSRRQLGDNDTSRTTRRRRARLTREPSLEWAMPHVTPSSDQPRKFRSSMAQDGSRRDAEPAASPDVLVEVPARADAHAHATPGQPQDHA
jgi:hypothetical protein